MKNFFNLLLLPFVLLSCKKEYSSFTQPGTTPSDTSTVRRLVMVKDQDSVAFDFTFGPSRQLRYLYVTEVYGGSTFNYSDTFFRDASSGQITKSVLVIYDATANFVDTTYYRYFPDGKLQSRVRAVEFSPGYRDSSVLSYESGKVKQEIRYVVGPADYNIERKSNYTIVGNDRLVEIQDSVFDVNTGNFEIQSNDLFTYVDTVANPLQLNPVDRVVLGFVNYSLNDYPWINFFAPQVLLKETYQSIYSSEVLTFEFFPYLVESGRPVKAKFSQISSGASGTPEVRYYYVD